PRPTRTRRRIRGLRCAATLCGPARRLPAGRNPSRREREQGPFLSDEASCCNRPAMGPERTLSSRFLRSVERHPSRPALELDGETLSNEGLYTRACGIGGELGEGPLSAGLAGRSPTAYAAVLGALLAGHGYVPLNPRFPAG